MNLDTMAYITTGDSVDIVDKDRGSGAPAGVHHGRPLSADDGDADHDRLRGAALRREVGQ